MKNKKVTIDELGITVRYQVRFSGEVTEKVAKQLQAMYDKDVEYSEDDDPVDGMIDSLEFSEEEADEEE